mmetsp:Transcript_720/g.2333  ORF Transcript_720/g.2333 Transcript_720/m.2333 type:complete len:348 (+) Transcript_720:4183-5226(+)
MMSQSYPQHVRKPRLDAALERVMMEDCAIPAESKLNARLEITVSEFSAMTTLARVFCVVLNAPSKTLVPSEVSEGFWERSTLSRFGTPRNRYGPSDESLSSSVARTVLSAVFLGEKRSRVNVDIGTQRSWSSTSIVRDAKSPGESVATCTPRMFSSSTLRKNLNGSLSGMGCASTSTAIPTSSTEAALPRPRNVSGLDAARSRPTMVKRWMDPRRSNAPSLISNAARLAPRLRSATEPMPEKVDVPMVVSRTFSVISMFAGTAAALEVRASIRGGTDASRWLYRSTSLRKDSFNGAKSPEGIDVSCGFPENVTTSRDKAPTKRSSRGVKDGLLEISKDCSSEQVLNG